MMATKYEYYDSGGDSDHACHSTNYVLAQTFTPSTTHFIYSVKIYAKKAAGSPGNVTVSIQGVDGSNHPDGNDLCSKVLSADGWSGSNEWHEFIMTTNPELSNGVMYAVVVEGTDGDSSNYIRWHYDNADASYAGGSMEESHDGGSSWITQTGDDAYFEEWGLVKETYTKTYTADALIQIKDLTQALTADTLLQKAFTSTLDADAQIRATLTKTLAADCILWTGSPEIEIAADVLLQKLGFTKTLTADTMIQKPGFTKTLTADAMLKKLGALSTFTADAMIQALGKTKTFTADTVLLNRILKTLTADCIISKAGVIKAFTASVIFYGMPEPCTLDLDFEQGGDIGIDFEQGGEIDLIFLGGASE